MEESPYAWGTSIFCDDIRFEAHGKISLMGIYQRDMIFPTPKYPLSLPKFAILVKYIEDKGRFTDDLTLKVYFPGEAPNNPHFSRAIKRNEASGRTRFDKYPAPEDSGPINISTIPLVFSPMHIAQEGYIKVRMECGNIITKLGTLLIRAALEEEKLT